MTVFLIALAICVLAAALKAMSKTDWGQRFEQKYTDKNEALLRDMDAKRKS